MSTETITTTTAELERMPAIEEQVDYLLRQIARIQDENKIVQYLTCVRKKQIKAFEFHAVPLGGRKAAHTLILNIDWSQHDVLTSSNPIIYTTTFWGDGEKKSVNPDVRYEAHGFMRKCVGFEVKWCFVYSSSDPAIQTSLNRQLGTRTIPSEEIITRADNMMDNPPVFDMGELHFSVST